MQGLDFRPLSESVQVGGHTLTVSALPCGLMRREVMPLVQDFGGELSLMDNNIIDRMLKVCHASVSKADPTITLEALDDSLMVADIGALFAHVIRVSGLSRRESDTGEAPRPVTAGGSGATSTGTSQRPRAGRSATSTSSSRSSRR